MDRVVRIEIPSSFELFYSHTVKRSMRSRCSECSDCSDCSLRAFLVKTKWDCSIDRRPDRHLRLAEEPAFKGSENNISPLLTSNWLQSIKPKSLSKFVLARKFWTTKAIRIFRRRWIASGFEEKGFFRQLQSTWSFLKCQTGTLRCLKDLLTNCLSFYSKCVAASLHRQIDRSSRWEPDTCSGSKISTVCFFFFAW